MAGTKWWCENVLVLMCSRTKVSLSYLSIYLSMCLLSVFVLTGDYGKYQKQLMVGLFLDEIPIMAF